MVSPCPFFFSGPLICCFCDPLAWFGSFVLIFSFLLSRSVSTLLAADKVRGVETFALLGRDGGQGSQVFK